MATAPTGHQRERMGVLLFCLPRSPTGATLSDTSGGTDRAAAVARAYDSGILATGSR